MLPEDIRTLLLEIKFRDNVFPILDRIANDHPHTIFLSANAAEPERRLNKPFGVKYIIPNSLLDNVREILARELPDMYRHYEVEYDHAKELTELVVIRPTDKYELIRIMGTNAEETHDLDTGTLLARLRRWEEEFGLILKGAGKNWVKFQLEKTPGELRDFVNELIAFAPATLGELEPRDLEKQLSDNHTIVIRW